MPERAGAAEQLQRLLHILPAAAREGGASYAELAASLGVTEDRVRKDIRDLTARELYHPAGTGDDIQLTLEADRVRVWTKGDFHRPARLSPREALSLALGFRAVAADLDDDARADFLARARRLEAGLASIPPDAFLPAWALSGVGDPPDATRGTLVQAARDGRRCRIRYLKPHEESPEAREVEPYVVVHAEGHWYALGRSPEKDEVRAFRLDRIIEVEPTDERFDVPERLDVEGYLSGEAVFFTEEETEVEVRYGPAVARWILERGVGEAQADGSVVVRHRVADLGWLVRHVLRYGEEAEVIGPANLRQKVREVVGRLFSMEAI